MDSNISTDAWWYQNSDLEQDFDLEYDPLDMSTQRYDSSQPNLYTTFSGYSDSTTPAGSETSHRSSFDSRASLTNIMAAPVSTVKAERLEKRRAQNRSAQRAYRGRIIQHQSKLEEQIAQLHGEYIRLSRVCAEQSGEMDRLKRRMLELGFQPEARGSVSKSQSQTPDRFDLFPHSDTGGGSQQVHSQKERVGFGHKP